MLLKVLQGFQRWKFFFFLNVPAFALDWWIVASWTERRWNKSGLPYGVSWAIYMLSLCVFVEARGIFFSRCKTGASPREFMLVSEKDEGKVRLHLPSLLLREALALWLRLIWELVADTGLKLKAVLLRSGVTGKSHYSQLYWWSCRGCLFGWFWFFSCYLWFCFSTGGWT